MPARLASDDVRAQTVSGAWLGAVRTALNSPGYRLFHLVTRIEQPIAEDAAVRQVADGLLAELKLPPIETVANTIFPSGLAAISKNWEHLSRRYRKAYPTLKRWRANRPGTYFGRLVAYPAAGHEIDQVGELIRKLRVELGTAGPKAARYELSLVAPGEALPAPSSASTGVASDADGNHADALSQPLPIQCPGEDVAAMAFPCLTYCSFQLDGSLLHAVAHYRSQYLVQRAYGNYLGLGRLLRYVSEQTELEMGELMVIGAYVQIDPGVSRPKLRAAIESIPDVDASPEAFG
jgi:hypothetical protein